MKNLLIVYHSQSGNTEKLAQACLRGAQKENVSIRFKNAFDTSFEDVIWCHGILIGTPENFGYMSGAIKDFFDRTYYPSREKNLQKPFGLFISCDTDGTGADREIGKIAKGYILKKALDTIIIKGEVQDSDMLTVEEMGQTMAAGIELEIF